MGLLQLVIPLWGLWLECVVFRLGWDGALIVVALAVVPEPDEVEVVQAEGSCYGVQKGEFASRRRRADENIGEVDLDEPCRL